MSAKLTTQDFIDRARAVHGDKYGYAFSVYQSTHEKVVIHCHEHGMFEQTPNSHLRGNGCPVCSGKKKHTNESFVEKAIEFHGGRYDYSKIEYVNAREKVTIICHDHGMFEQEAHSHLRGVGCPSCAYEVRAESKKLTPNDFIQKARDVHGENKYDYSLVDYVDSRTKVIIQCREHRLFEQTPASHLSGQGCPGCAKSGFDRTRLAALYVLRSCCGRYMKIGITHNPKQRCGKLVRTTPFSFKRIEMVEGDGEFISNLEKQLLAKYKPVAFTERFDGSTEWRLWDSNIVNQIKQEKFKYGKN